MHQHYYYYLPLPTKPRSFGTTSNSNYLAPHPPTMAHRRPWILVASSALIVLLPSSYTICAAFLSPSYLPSRPSTIISFPSSRAASTSPSRRNAIINGNQQQQPDAPKTTQEDADLQWELYTRHQAVSGGEWWGNWMTYNYMGDLVDSSVVG